MNENPPDPRNKTALWTYDDVAVYIGVKTPYVRKMVADGKLRAIRMGHKVIRFTKELVDADLAKLSS